MSSKAKKLESNIENNKKLKLFTLYSTLMGSIIVTMGKLVGKTEEEMLDDFAYYSKDEELFKCKNIKEVCDYVKRDYGVVEEYEKYIVLCYDEANKYTPLCTLVDDEGYVQPLDRDGNYLGVLAQDDFEMEYIFESESKIEN